MAPYEVRFSADARRQFAKLEPRTRERLTPAIGALANDPRPPGAKLLKGPTREFMRIRVGAWRVVYKIDQGLVVVEVVALGHRHEVYRRF